MNIAYLLQKADSGLNPFIEYLNQPWDYNDVKETIFSVPCKKILPDKFNNYWKNKLVDEMRSRKYSIKTQKAYIYYNRLLCNTLQKTPEEIYKIDVTVFLSHMEKEKDSSASAINLAISAINFFYKCIKNIDIGEKRRPKKDKRLPVVLSKEEIMDILNMEKNPKHKLLLMLVYSSGLRVSEVVMLKKEDLDLNRQIVFIKLGKGRKDRVTMLSEKASQYLKDYYNIYKSNKWIFPGQRAAPGQCAAPGQRADRHLSIRSAQYIFDKALKNAGIIKKASIHSLRHSFATHLLENGTDIRYIQNLLGHENIRTTERYTHVARGNVLKIKSPLDTII